MEALTAAILDDCKESELRGKKQKAVATMRLWIIISILKNVRLPISAVLQCPVKAKVCPERFDHFVLCLVWYQVAYSSTHKAPTHAVLHSSYHRKIDEG